ncbi:MAG: MFS transporter [Trueperaceae bacterium]|nr:MFS transporter [Trueperaceae bacterium]
MVPAARVTAGSAIGLSGLLVAVHATNDAFSSMLAALLPTLQVRFGLTETVLAVLVATLSFSSSVTQPLFGGIADRYGRRLMAALGVATSSMLLSLIAIAPSPVWLFALLFVGGLGSAAFHPAATGLARGLGGPRKGLAVSVFSSGGTLGLAVGPLVIGALAMSGRLDLSPWLMLPGLVGALALYRWMPAQPRPPRAQRPKLVDLSLLRGPVGLLALAGILRSISFVTFTNAVPLWLVGTRGFAPDAAVVFWTLTTFSFAAGVGGILSGALERRVPLQVLITGSMLFAMVPLGLLFVVPIGGFGYFVAVAIAGALVNGGLPLMIVAAQDLAPHAMGAASGLMMGFTWGMAGVLYIGIGALQEAFGVQAAMAGSFLTLLPGALLAFTVLRRHRAAIDAAG